jgi:hypothetical protein
VRVVCVGGSPSDELVMSSLRRLCDLSDSDEEVLSVCGGVEVLLLFGDGHSSVSELSELDDGVSCGEICVFCLLRGRGVPFHIFSLRSAALRCLFHILSKGFDSSSSMVSLFWVRFLPYSMFSGNSVSGCSVLFRLIQAPCDAG